MTKPNDRTNQMQARYLRERVVAHNSEQRNRIRNLGEIPEPTSIVAARKIVKQFCARNCASKRKAQKAANRRLATEFEKVKQTILFGSPVDALKAVQEFECRRFA